MGQQPYPSDPRYQGYDRSPYDDETVRSPNMGGYGSPNQYGQGQYNQNQYAPGQGQYDQNQYGQGQYNQNQYTPGPAQGQGQYGNNYPPQGNTPPRPYKDPYQSRANMRYLFVSVTYFLFGVLEVVLGLRVLFRLLAANQYNAFVSFLYSLSAPFVDPFNGIFNIRSSLGQSVFDISAVVAMLIYALVGWGLVTLWRVLFAPSTAGPRY